MSLRSILPLSAFLVLSGTGLPAADVASSQDAEFLRAVSNAPALGAASRRSAAARARIESAGRLPDPTVEGMGSRMVGPMDERSTMWEVNVRQALPKAGERAADRQRAQAGAAMAEADFAVMAGEMAADTAMAIAEADGAEARIRLLQTQIGRLDSVLRSIEARIATSGGRLADRLTVQSRLASMQLMVEEERRMAADALSGARGRLGLAPDAPLPRFAAPSIAEISPEEAAAVRLAAARTDEANAMVKMARASARPMTSVGVRFEREKKAMGNDDTLGLAFMSEIPWRNRRYARAEVRAAESERAAAGADANAARFRISTALTRVDRAEKLAETARRLAADTLARLTAENEALIRAAGANAGGMAGESTILQTVELLEKMTDTESQVIRAETAAKTARAELWRYVPASRFFR